MRNAIVNANSPKEDIWGVLTGIWNQYKAGPNNEWTIVKCPLFIHMEAVLNAGRTSCPSRPIPQKRFTGRRRTVPAV